MRASNPNADLTIQRLRQEASDAAYRRYTVPAQIAGVVLSVAGVGFFGVLLPVGAIGTIAGVSVGVLTYACAIAHTTSEMDKCETGGVAEIKRYLKDEQINQIALDVNQPKKELAQETPTPKPSQSQNQPSKSTSTVPETGNEFPEPSAQLPVAPVQLSGNAPHVLMFGRSQNGKTTTVAHVLQGINVDYISLKAKDQVPADWNGYLISPTNTDAQLNWILDRWEAMLNSALGGEGANKHAFVIDEYISIRALIERSTRKRLTNFYVRLLTTGAGMGLLGGKIGRAHV